MACRCVRHTDVLTLGGGWERAGSLVALRDCVQCTLKKITMMHWRKSVICYVYSWNLDHPVLRAVCAKGLLKVHWYADTVPTAKRSYPCLPLSTKFSLWPNHAYIRTSCSSLSEAQGKVCTEEPLAWLWTGTVLWSTCVFICSEKKACMSQSLNSALTSEDITMWHCLPSGLTWVLYLFGPTWGLISALKPLTPKELVLLNDTDWTIHGEMT